MAGANILFIGFGELMKSVEGRLSSSPNVTFQEIQQLSSDVHENLLSNADIFLVGPYTLEPVRQIQRAAQQNPLVSIIVLIFPDQFQKVKQAVQFAYNVGKNVTFVAYDLGKDITAVFDNALLRAKQRKSFARIAEQQVYPKAQSPVLTYQNLHAFLENASIGAIVFDDHRHIITANRKAKQIFFPKLETLTNVRWDDLFPDEQSALTTMPSKEGQEQVHKVIRVNHQFLELNISSLQLNKQNVHYLLLLNDITDKIKAENKLQAKVAELEFLNEELDQFVNVISHDFKTPLTSISLLAELGIKESDPVKKTQFLSQIHQSAGKLKELLKGLNVLVDVTKTRSEKVETVDFQQRLDVVMTDYEILLEQAGGKLNADFDAATQMNYFTAHIDSLFSNLVTNAIKYRNPEQPLIIQIKTRRERDYTVLSVKDNGSGIDLAKNMNKLFQPFKRLTDHGTGSGLGLSIIKRVIEKNQGYLEVFSQPGAGTEFKAYLKSPIV
ncbi:sensor histidine kinase [Mucilaginibacter ginkgonis]|uniref:histidine kinase n=1 Tax=Mucilaginibacter ginkgonis TaxID=2682091 RepID=A0A6I4HU35_9SPHI|nr:PAS domain-containing sensor histidine kinase [Mucilaginibacter ginkgonis]QQL50291.1 PAS domain S-box protein [Mucilaginibacter ginkgonis]